MDNVQKVCHPTERIWADVKQWVASKNMTHKRTSSNCVAIYSKEAGKRNGILYVSM
jgi:hypothetical protein